ncbi:dipeptidyl aminopeptidase/acylaminoacyl peptidase [Owenweeksia hongkongensis DSM 17368]|uniref:Dipeptidyl aminopeptidase/acylaminoacyl peptidase n=1 Tax=Owenweeksia hongkongensis (strain DSM 17368 / CIP 108786 / JCM 12287 / NRRL B-23963 / UST20020801) TaxID=926562 RepID=G8R219_OWEHD|nr:S9 family peptidase [Owenweeksia hongkongensis]AEV33969.1 dipeptidyl aminopeptidase/acylaminoacyl peptidase [Owenweeksia hongkongensis DSM 17368]
MIRTTFSVLMLVGMCFQASAQGKKVTLEDVWKRYEFAARSTSALNSMNDGLHYTAITKTDNGPTLEKFSYKTGESVGLIISANVIEEQTGKRVNFVDYEFSPNEDKVLLATDQESIYRHSSKSRYYVYDLKNGKLDSLATEGKQQLATFSPTRNQVAFVKDNRLHIQDFDSGSRELISFGKGEDDAFIAGAVDWVYEEEFSFHKGFEWSPDGDYIAYYQTDEREVPQFTMDIYGKGLYPSEDEFKYPKAGEPNSDVSIHLFDVKKKADTKVELTNDYEYIPRIKWTTEDDELVIYSMNRLQNQLTLWKVDAKSAGANVLYQENAPAYLEINDNLRFLKDGSFIWTSERDGFMHIYHMGKDGSIKKQITKGNWDVTEFYGFDEDGKTFYYQAAEESPMERAVYSIKLNGSGKKKLSTQKGWNDAEFSNGFKFYINTYSSKDVPTLETLHNSKGEVLRTITDNAALKTKLRSYDIAQKNFFKFENEEGTELNGWMIKPQNFEEGKKYPVLMFVYGGPGSQTVKNQYDGFNHFYYQSLANQGYIIVSVDNRGTGARGRDFRTVTYKQLGKYEIEDQISAAKYLGGLPYVDKGRIGIWGWSYGGYMSSLGLTKGAEVFTMAIAVAPVTNWRFYDSIYTERYMDTPQNNGNGYDDNSPINHVEKMRGKYLLVHGSADDNVHVQNTMRMVSALVAADKQFDLFIYPDKNHGIYGGNTRFHLYKMMNDFILENL